MRFFDYIRTAIENIASAKLRSLLTSLGIIIGIGSVVLITSIEGESAQQSRELSPAWAQPR